MKKINIGIIGAGFTSQTCHIPNFYKNKKVRIIALAEKRKKMRILVANKYKIKKTFSNHLELINECKNLDAVVVIVRRDENYEVVKDCLKKKINVFSEKPMCKTLSQAKNLLKIIKKNKKIYKVGFNKIYDKGVLEGKKIFEDTKKTNKLGKFLYFKFYRFSGTGYDKNIKFIKTNEKILNEKNKKKNFPGFLNRKYYNFYDNYLNVYSHNINLLNYFFTKKPQIENFYDKNRFQLLVLNYQNFFGTLETNFKKDYEWDEQIIFYFEKGKIVIKIHPQQIKNRPASVYIKPRERKNHKVKIKQNSWSFKEQSVAFIDDLIKNDCQINSAQKCIKDLILVEDIFSKL